MMNRHTGRAIEGIDHLMQSIADILTTPIGTRVMRRTYGSQVPMLIDQPDNMTTQIRVFSATASALMRWEPRFQLTQLSIERDPDTKGKATIHLSGNYLNPAAAKAKAIRLSVGVST